MSEEREFAKEAAALCVACLSFSWTTGGVGAVVLPVIALLGIGRALWAQCPDRACAGVVETVIADMTRSGNVPTERIAAARRALATIPAGVTLPAADLARDATDARGFATAVAARLLDALDPPPDANTRSLIEIALTTAFETCRTRPEFRAALSESLLIRIAREQGVVLGTVQRIETKIDHVGAALGNLATANRDLLEALAARFRIAEPFDLSDAALRQELEKKAEDYRRLLKEVADLKGMSARIDNVHAAAMDAIRNLRLDEARGLLRDARAILREESLRPVLEQNARLMEAEADIELLAGNAQAAFDLLSAAADSFAGIDRAEVARRRLRYGDRLYVHGSKYGGPSLALAAQMFRKTLALLDRNRDAYNWAVAKNNLANALRAQGSHTTGFDGLSLLEQSVAALRSALTVWTEINHPNEWATAQNNLAISLRSLGAATKGAKGDALLLKAISACNSALRVRKSFRDAKVWSSSQLALANALQTLGERAEGKKGASFSAQAICAYRAALQILTEAEHPVDWATTQSNLANPLRNQGERTAGEEGAALLAEAVAACRAALRVWTEAEHPVNWAKTQENLALAEQSLADHDTTADPRPHLEAALAHVEAALRVFDPDHLPFNHAKATDLRDDLLARLAALPPA